MSGRWRAVLGVVGLKVAGLLAYVVVVRPWLLHWGTGRTERTEPLPGDELVLRPRVRSTRAVTVDAGVDDVWPWLAQLGQNKGGLYSYDWLENLVGCDIHSADRVVPEWQDVRAGDEVRMVPEGTTPDLAFEVICAQPGRALVLGPAGDDDPATVMAGGLPYASWAFVLDPVSDHSCRLIVRYRADYDPTPLGWLGLQVLLEPIQFVMERKTLLGIKRRAERRALERSGDHRG